MVAAEEVAVPVPAGVVLVVVDKEVEADEMPSNPVCRLKQALRALS